MHSTKYALMGKWGSAYNAQMTVARKLVEGISDEERRIVSAIHHLGIARLMHEKIIDGYGHEVIPSTYAYAFSAAREFSSLAHDAAPTHFEVLLARSLDIMRVMSDNGPFVEFR